MNVNEAFNKFLSNSVRLNTSESDNAKASKSWLISQIESFQDDEGFFQLHPEKYIDFGSFARKTKIPPLNDVDLMVILHAQGGWYDEIIDRIEITVDPDATSHSTLCHENSVLLNSRKVVNKFVEYLKDVPQYRKAEIKRNQEAATLNLTSYAWTFDIVPCFQTTIDSYGRTFFLIPDGKGHWKKTDPRVDKQRITRINRQLSASVYDIIRLIKYWNSKSSIPTISSYLLETIVLDYYANKSVTNTSLAAEIKNVLYYLHNNIFAPVQDPKGIQGNMNDLPYDVQCSISEKAKADYDEATKAVYLESIGFPNLALRRWSKIFGAAFPIN